ncbi:hypothetical protein CIK05_00285 [Bdellovibrio sp. qaytius]|nr:hypothetical protein CIK05_00285 [Bdellovibrio sp. qaytius]
MIRFLSLLISITFFTAPTFAGWGPWTSLDGIVVGDPAACSALGRTFVVVRGTDNTLWYRMRIGTGNWNAWTSIPLPNTLHLTGSPSVACFVDKFALGHINVSVIGADGKGYYSYQSEDDTFPKWFPLATAGLATGKLDLTSGFSTPSYGDTNAFFPTFGVGSDRKVYELTCTSTTDCYKTWKPISRVVASDPAATSKGGIKYLVVQQMDNNLYMTSETPTGWGPYIQIPDSAGVTSSPDIISLGQYNFELFARGNGFHKNLLHKTWTGRNNGTGTWSNWENLGGTLTAGPGAATAFSSKRMLVFIRGGDNALWYRYWEP